jgi:hypothetical protein
VLGTRLKPCVNEKDTGQLSSIFIAGMLLETPREIESWRNPNRSHVSNEETFPFVNVCPDCLNNGMFRAPIVQEGPVLLFYCQCSIGTDALAGALNLFRFTQAVSRAG